MELLNPSFTLFIYDIRETLGASEKDKETYRQHFLSKLTKASEEQRKILRESDVKAKHKEIDLYLDSNGNITIDLSGGNHEGWYYPIKLEDTYTLLVDFSDNKNKHQPQPVESIVNLKKTLYKDYINWDTSKPGLGSSLVLWAQYQDGDPDTIAHQIYHQILGSDSKEDWQADLQGQADLFGAKIYEIWKRPTDWETLEESEHLLICLVPRDKNLDEFLAKDSLKRLTRSLIYLFCYRSKILWAYYKSRKLQKSLKGQFDELQATIQTIISLPAQIASGELNLQNLQETLTQTLRTLSTYAIGLSLLEDHSRTLIINLGNYKKRLRLIQKDIPALEFMNHFCEIATDPYLEQIQADYANLQPGLTLLENLINTLQGIIQVEQTKRDVEQTKADRQINSTVAIVGIGLALSQIATAVVVAKYDPSDPQTPFYQEQAFWLSFTLVFIIVIALPLLIFGINRLFRWLYKGLSQLFHR